MWKDMADDCSTAAWCFHASTQLSSTVGGAIDAACRLLPSNCCRRLAAFELLPLDRLVCKHFGSTRDVSHDISRDTHEILERRQLEPKGANSRRASRVSSTRFTYGR